MDKKHRIYRKKPGATNAVSDFPLSTVRLRADPAAKAAADVPRTESRAALAEANRIVLDRFAPPSVLVDEHFHVVQFSGQTGPYLEPSPGQPSFHELKLAREGRLHGLRTVL